MSKRVMKDSGIEWIGKIPIHWEVRKLGSLMDFINGYAFNSSEFNFNATIPVVRIGDLQNGRINFQSCLRTDNKEYGRSFLMNGDIALAMSGATTGKTAYVSEICDTVATNQRVGIIRIVSKNKKYIYYTLNTSIFRDYVELLSIGSAQPNLSTENVKAYKFPLPPIHEQQAIANYLDEQVSRLDQLIEDQQQVIEDWKAYKQSLITETVTKGLNPEVEMKDSGIEWIGEIPSHWGVAKLKKIISEKITDGPHETPEFISEGVPFLSVDAIVDGKLSFNNCRFVSILAANEYLKKCYPKKGDILMGKSASIGKIAMVVSDDKFCVWSPLALIRIDKLKSFNKYIEYHLKSNISQYEIEIRCTNSTQKNIGMKTISNLTIIIPPLHEQQQIADFLDEKCLKIDQLIEDKQRLIEDLKAYKQSLIYECVTGKKEIV